MLETLLKTIEERKGCASCPALQQDGDWYRCARSEEPLSYMNVALLCTGPDYELCQRLQASEMEAVL